jgi:hypothetical protein
MAFVEFVKSVYLEKSIEANRNYLNLPILQQKGSVSAPIA